MVRRWGGRSLPDRMDRGFTVLCFEMLSFAFRIRRLSYSVGLNIISRLVLPSVFLHVWELPRVLIIYTSAGGNILGQANVNMWRCDGCAQGCEGTM